MIWEDLIKLRYLKKGRLLKNMSGYVMKMAEIFDGFRLDNTHSTEIWVGEYMMRKARKVKNNLIVFAELFTGDATIDILFTKKLVLYL